MIYILYIEINCLKDMLSQMSDSLTNIYSNSLSTGKNGSQPACPEYQLGQENSIHSSNEKFSPEISMEVEKTYGVQLNVLFFLTNMLQYFVYLQGDVVLLKDFAMKSLLPNLYLKKNRITIYIKKKKKKINVDSLGCC